MTVHVPPDLLEELRDAVVALQGKGERLTLAGLAEEAIREKLEDLRREHNQRRPFPPRKGELVRGRPIR